MGWPPLKKKQKKKNRLHGLGNESLWERDFPHLYNEYWGFFLGGRVAEP